MRWRLKPRDSRSSSEMENLLVMAVEMVAFSGGRGWEVLRWRGGSGVEVRPRKGNIFFLSFVSIWSLLLRFCSSRLSARALSFHHLSPVSIL